MSAESHPPADRRSGASGSHPVRLVSVAEAAALLGLTQSTLWKLVADRAIRVHPWAGEGERGAAMDLDDILRLRADPSLTPRPRLVRRQGWRDPRSTVHRMPAAATPIPSNLQFELELLRAEHANARDRIARMEKTLHSRTAELERVEGLVEEERAQRLQREILKSHLAEVGGRLDGTHRRIEALEDALRATREAHEEELATLDANRNAERAALAGENRRLVEEEARLRRELEALRRTALVGRAERDRLQSELETAVQVERATQKYCNRLEEHLRAARAEPGE